MELRLSSAGRPPLVLTASDVHAPPFFPKESTSEERDQLDKVVDALYISSYRTARKPALLREHGVTHILSVGSEFADDAKTRPSADAGIEQLVKDIDDDPDDATSSAMSHSLHELAEYIHKAIASGGGVMVHCAAGASRSPTVVLAFLLIKQRAAFPTLRDAFAHLHALRPCMWPNDGFMRALIALEVELTAASSISIGEYEAWAEYEPPPEEQRVDSAAVRLAGIDTGIYGPGKGSHWNSGVGEGQSPDAAARLALPSHEHARGASGAVAVRVRVEIDPKRVRCRVMSDV